MIRFILVGTNCTVRYPHLCHNGMAIETAPFANSGQRRRRYYGKVKRTSKNVWEVTAAEPDIAAEYEDPADALPANCMPVMTLDVVVAAST